MIMNQCPNCSKRYVTPSDHVGETITCSSCGEDFVIRQSGVTVPSSSYKSNTSVASGGGCMALFDFKFSAFITPSFIRIYYTLFFWFSFLVGLVILISAIANISKLPLLSEEAKALFMVLAVVLAPIVWLINLGLVRMGLEFTMAIFNMERLAQQIEKNTRKEL